MVSAGPCDLPYCLAIIKCDRQDFAVQHLLIFFCVVFWSLSFTPTSWRRPKFNHWYLFHKFCQKITGEPPNLWRSFTGCDIPYIFLENHMLFKNQILCFHAIISYNIMRKFSGSILIEKVKFRESVWCINPFFVIYDYFPFFPENRGDILEQSIQFDRFLNR